MQKEKIKKNECSTCGHQNDIYTQFCVNCGTIVGKSDILSNKHKGSLIKICPDCSYKNEVSLRRCLQCGKSLVGVKVQAESSLPAPLQQSSADKDSSNSFSEGISSENQLNMQSIPMLENYTLKQSKTALTTNIPLPPTPPIKTQPKRNWLIGLVMIILIVSIIFILLPRISGNPKSSLSMGLGEFNASNGELLGVNDGSFVPFLTDGDGQLKQQAADQLKQGHGSQAISLWQAAIHIKNNDAEALIYIENQSVLLSGVPYFTLVAGTDLLEPSGSGLSDLQGIYVAQHEFNNENHGFRIRILIANSGTDINNVTLVARRIVNIATQDKTVVGVISWLSSTENITALQILAIAHIPMISPTASSDRLTSISPYFFRIVPPNNVQGKDTALFAEHTLHAKRAVVFVDNHDSYSQNLVQDFEKQFRLDGNTILKEEPFTKGHTANIGALIQDALAKNPDLLYFTSPDTSDVANFQDALPTSGPFAHLAGLAGDSGYVIHKAGYNRWYFASFAFANAVNLTGSTPPFYQDYINDFNSDGLRSLGYYGYTRPDDITILSYDVTSVFLKAMQQAIINNKITITSTGLQLITPPLLANTLPHVVLQGVSGLIAFDSDHNPVNKPIVFLAASANGIYMKDWLGCFTQTLCRNAS